MLFAVAHSAAIAKHFPIAQSSLNFAEAGPLPALLAKLQAVAARVATCCHAYVAFKDGCKTITLAPVTLLAMGVTAGSRA